MHSSLRWRNTEICVHRTPFSVDCRKRHVLSNAKRRAREKSNRKRISKQTKRKTKRDLHKIEFKIRHSFRSSCIQCTNLAFSIATSEFESSNLSKHEELANSRSHQRVHKFKQMHSSATTSGLHFTMRGTQRRSVRREKSQNKFRVCVQFRCNYYHFGARLFKPRLDIQSLPNRRHQCHLETTTTNSECKSEQTKAESFISFAFLVISLQFAHCRIDGNQMNSLWSRLFCGLLRFNDNRSSQLCYANVRVGDVSSFCFVVSRFIIKLVANGDGINKSHSMSSKTAEPSQFWLIFFLSVRSSSVLFACTKMHHKTECERIENDVEKMLSSPNAAAVDALSSSLLRYQIESISNSEATTTACTTFYSLAWTCSVHSIRFLHFHLVLPFEFAASDSKLNWNFFFFLFLFRNACLRQNVNFHVRSEAIFVVSFAFLLLTSLHAIAKWWKCKRQEMRESNRETKEETRFPRRCIATKTSIWNLSICT